MKKLNILSASAEQTIQLGVRLARHLKKGSIICLQGDLGTGKTTLVKGIARGLKINPEKVNSPTFVIMNSYQGRLPLYHFDLYRLEDIKEIPVIGYEEFLYGDGVCVIEWAERLGALAPKEYLRVELKHKGENERSIDITMVGEQYYRIMKGMVNGK